jgi:hypothetical protein
MNGAPCHLEGDAYVPTLGSSHPRAHISDSRGKSKQAQT